jgi:hypothetical protein
MKLLPSRASGLSSRPIRSRDIAFGNKGLRSGLIRESAATLIRRENN